MKALELLVFFYWWLKRQQIIFCAKWMQNNHNRRRSKLELRAFWVACYGKSIIYVFISHNNRFVGNISISSLPSISIDVEKCKGDKGISVGVGWSLLVFFFLINNRRDLKLGRCFWWICVEICEGWKQEINSVEWF